MGSLLQVANHLAEMAKKRSGDDADAFGRTAFNRYYYAAFLSTRDLFIRIEDSWSRAAHRNIPSLLERDLLKRVKNTVKKQESSRLLTQKKARSLVHQAQAASSELASILRTAYAVRVTADYVLEARISVTTELLELAAHNDAEAREWIRRIEHQKGVLIHVYEELGLV